MAASCRGVILKRRKFQDTATRGRRRHESSEYTFLNQDRLPDRSADLRRSSAAAELGLDCVAEPIRAERILTLQVQADLIELAIGTRFRCGKKGPEQLKTHPCDDRSTIASQKKKTGVRVHFPEKGDGGN
jgi:hypothetical protein